MNSIRCNRCGTDYDTSMSCCPSCGFHTTLEHEQMVDRREQELRELLKKARDNAQTGDLANALRYAREALSHRQDCSTTHALLGQLYEQQGDASAAKYHFQAALNVSRPEPEELPIVEEPAIERQPKPSGFMMLILIGCILFSGMAALLAFRPGKFHFAIGSVTPIQKQPVSLPDNPRWTRNVPHSLPPAPAQTETADNTAITPSAPPDVKMTSSETTVLGPARKMAPISGMPSLEMADQAFFRGEFDLAVTLYEAVLPTLQNPNPRIYRDCAWCYQQLGNSRKASDYLGKAVQGYQEQLDSEPANTAALQELERCQAALQTLAASQDETNGSAP